MACLSKRSLGAPISLRSHRSLSAVSDGAKEASGKFQIYFRKYGWTFVGTYLGLYVTTLGSVFVALNFDLFSAADFGFDAKVLTAKVVPSLRLCRPQELGQACESLEYYTGIKSLPDFIRKPFHCSSDHLILS
jgi:hypothetical protein